MKNLLRFFSFGRHSIHQATTILAITAVVSNILGLARNIVFSRFNSPGELDVYYSSFRAADLVFNFLIFGAITAAVIPSLSSLISEKKEEEARETTNQLISWSIVLLIIIGGILCVAMPSIVTMLAPSWDADKQHLTVVLGRLLLLQPLIFSASFILGALLNGYQRFTSYSFAPLLYNASLIMGGLASSVFGVRAITASVIIGSLLHLTIQAREIWMTGFRFRFTLKVSEPLIAIIKKMGQPNLSQGFGQLVLTLYTRLLTGLPTGSVFIYSVINNLQTTPTVVVGNSLAAASFPGVVAAITNKDWDRLNELLAKTIRTSLFILIPTVVLSIVLRAQIVRLYIGIGHQVGWELTETGINTFSYFMLGVIPASLAIILGRLFYAHKDTWTPMLIGLISGTIAMITAYIGIKVLGNSVATIGVAETISSVTQCWLMLFILYRRRHFRLSLKELLGHSGRFVLGSFWMALACWASLQAMDALYAKIGFLSTASIPGLFLQMLVASLVGAGAYFRYSTHKSKEELQWVQKRGFSNAN